MPLPPVLLMPLLVLVLVLPARRAWDPRCPPARRAAEGESGAKMSRSHTAPPFSPSHSSGGEQPLGTARLNEAKQHGSSQALAALIAIDSIEEGQEEGGEPGAEDDCAADNADEMLTLRSSPRSSDSSGLSGGSKRKAKPPPRKVRRVASAPVAQPALPAAAAAIRPICAPAVSGTRASP
jgi:hypothetical protein